MTIEKDENSWTTVIKRYHKCAHCKKGVLDTRIKRGFFVKHLVFWATLKRYQCNVCGRKSYLKN